MKEEDYMIAQLSVHPIGEGTRLSTPGHGFCYDVNREIKW